MWIKIMDPKDSSSEPWVGKVFLDDEREAPWKFELIRSLADMADIYSPMKYFNELDVITGLIDLQRECTLIHPFVTNLDPGSFGVYQNGARTRIEGQCSALLDKASIDDLDAPSIAGISFSSDSFAAWYNQPSSKPTKDRSPDFQEPQDKLTFQVAGLGRVTCQSGISSHVSTWENKQRTYAVFGIEFDSAQSLSAAMKWCWELESLFQFLTGLSTKWPVFSLKRIEKYRLDSDECHYYGELTFGRTPAKNNKRPHPFECTHNNGRFGAGLEKIISSYIANRSCLSERIQAIHYARYLTKTLQNKFMSILPVLEGYLVGIYETSSEQAFRKYEEKFFDWIESANDDAITEFSKKHIRVVEAKKASLKNLLSLAIDSLNREGFNFSQALSSRVTKRRGRAVHKNLNIENETDARKFQAEIWCTVAILALHTYRDLGLDISQFERGRQGNQEIQWFFKKTGEQGEVSFG